MAIGIAIATALVNMAHLVALTLFEAVRYRGGFAKFFRTVSLLGHPAGGACQPVDFAPYLEADSRRLRLPQGLQDLLCQLRTVLGPQWRRVDPQDDAVLVDLLEGDAGR